MNHCLLSHDTRGSQLNSARFVETEQFWGTSLPNLAEIRSQYLFYHVYALMFIHFGDGLVSVNFLYNIEFVQCHSSGLWWDMKLMHCKPLIAWRFFLSYCFVINHYIIHVIQYVLNLSSSMNKMKWIQILKKQMYGNCVWTWNIT